MGRPHFKDVNPASWDEMLATCNRAARDGLAISVAQRSMRHLGFSLHSLIGWVKDGLIPSYTYEGVGKYKPTPEGEPSPRALDNGGRRV